MKYIDESRHRPNNKKCRDYSRQGVCCGQAVGHSLEKGGDADGTQRQGSRPTLRTLRGRDLFDRGRACPKSVLAAGGNQRLA